MIDALQNSSGALDLEEEPLVPTAMGPVRLPQLCSPIAGVLEAIGEGGGLATLRELEAAAIRRTLRLLGGNKTEAAKALGLDRRTLHRKIQKMRAK